MGIVVREAIHRVGSCPILDILHPYQMKPCGHMPNASHEIEPSASNQVDFNLAANCLAVSRYLNALRPLMNSTGTSSPYFCFRSAELSMSISSISTGVLSAARRITVFISSHRQQSVRKYKTSRCVTLAPPCYHLAFDCHPSRWPSSVFRVLPRTIRITCRAAPA
jgi:hypothetical protein